MFSCRADAKILKKLQVKNRGKSVKFRVAHAYTDSSSSLVRRVLDTIYFALRVVVWLMIIRPKVIYISTDPPLLAPFIVAVYSKLCSAKFIYHLQDIHPEITASVKQIPYCIFIFLRWIDSWTMSNASLNITLTSQMKTVILRRTNCRAKVKILSNPSVDFTEVKVQKKPIHGFSFCGNIGRLQRIPLVIEAIKKYLDSGGTMKFIFAGGGVYSRDVELLSSSYPNVFYLGLVDSLNAAQISAKYSWALLPIEDKVTDYAFPSKSSSYVFSNASILAICGEKTSVSSWVLSNKLGIVVKPDVESIFESFKRIEVMRGRVGKNSIRKTLKEQLTISRFVKHLEGEILSMTTLVRN